jgi:hypothetical protein
VPPLREERGRGSGALHDCVCVVYGACSIEKMAGLVPLLWKVICDFIACLAPWH